MQDTAFEILDKENYRSHEAVSHSDLKLLSRPSEFHRVKLLGEEREQKDQDKLHGFAPTTTKTSRRRLKSTVGSTMTF